MQLTKMEVDRFWAKVEIPPFGERLGFDDWCWPWTAARSSGGYGSFKLRGSAVCASRLSLIMATGRNEPDERARHSCDNPDCVRPKHLKWGTVKENSMDMMERGRHRNQHSEMERAFWTEEEEVFA